MHSWIFRHRRRLEQLYGLAPGRPPAARAAAAAGGRGPGPAAGAAQARERLRARVLVPAPRRAAA